jgi:hypothetical protein
MGVDDNFFDIGGSVWLAGMLFAEIAQECGRELPSATIDHAPTIRGLGVLVGAAHASAIFAVRPDESWSRKAPDSGCPWARRQRAVFELAKQIRTGHALCGNQAMGIDGPRGDRHAHGPQLPDWQTALDCAPR